ncbi:Uncharacterized protein DAT39_014093, partial [Clarias magur]
ESTEDLEHEACKHSHTVGKSKMKMSLICMSSDRGRKLEYPEETHQTQTKQEHSTKFGPK